MSADLLRRAAQKMRALAVCGDANAFPAPWSTAEADMDHHGVADFVVCDNGEGDVTDAIDPQCAAHIAAWDPDVARAIADWLDETAGTWTRVDPDFPDGNNRWERRAVAVARAFLGDNA